MHTFSFSALPASSSAGVGTVSCLAELEAGSAATEPLWGRCGLGGGAGCGGSRTERHSQLQTHTHAGKQTLNTITKQMKDAPSRVPSPPLCRALVRYCSRFGAAGGRMRRQVWTRSAWRWRSSHCWSAEGRSDSAPDRRGTVSVTHMDTHTHTRYTLSHRNSHTTRKILSSYYTACID